MAKPSYLSQFEAPKPAEIDSLPIDGEILFLDIHSINALRSVQHSIHAEAIDHIRATHGSLLSFTEIETEATKDCVEAYDEVAADFLQQFVAVDNPKYDEYLTAIREFSIDKISEEEMAIGKIDDATGERDEETAGYKLLEKVRAEKIAELVPTDPNEIAKAERLATAAERKAELALAEGKLDNARKALAEAEVQYRTKKMFARKKHNKEQYETLKTAYEEATKNAAIAGFASIKADREAAEEVALTPEQLNKIAQIAFATEFGKYAEAQNEVAYMTEYGKKVRSYGEVTLKKRLLRTATVLGIGALGMATGGIFAAGFYGAAAGLRMWQTKSAGTVGHSTAKGTDRITKKVNRKNVQNTNAILDLNHTDDTEALANIIASGQNKVVERTHSSNSRRRKMVPILIGSALVGGIMKGVSEYESSKDTFAQVKQNLTNFDWNPFRTHDITEVNATKPEKAGTGLTFSGEETYVNEAVPFVPKTTSTDTATDIVSSATNKQGSTEGIAVALDTNKLDIGGEVAGSGQNLENMSRLFTSPGAHPWDRAVAFYNGDMTGAHGWLDMAVKKAGAEWVGSGSSRYIRLANGVTDTDTVWKTLTEAMLSK